MSSKDEDERYLEEVVQELRRREGVLRSIEREIEELRHRLEGVQLGKSLRRGDVVRLKSAEEYRAQLKEDLKGKLRKRNEALEDIARAKSRKEMVEEDLKSLSDEK